MYIVEEKPLRLPSQSGGFFILLKELSMNPNVYFSLLASGERLWTPKFLIRHFQDLETGVIMHQIVEIYTYFKDEGKLLEGEWFKFPPKEISEYFHIPHERIEQIFQRLIDEGLISPLQEVPNYYKINLNVLEPIIKTQFNK